MAWWLITQATSGLRQTSKATSGPSIREQAKSLNTPCLIRVRTARIRPCSTRKDLFQLRPPFRPAEGVVSNIVATPDGKLYLACSSVNKIGIAEILHYSGERY